MLHIQMLLDPVDGYQSLDPSFSSSTNCLLGAGSLVLHANLLIPVPIEFATTDECQ